MAKRLQHRGGTTSQHSTFTGAVREVTVDTDKNTLVVHDGATAGGHPLATATNFTSTGIDDNATSTAITIDSSENVGIGTNSPSKKLDITGNNGSGVNNVLRFTDTDTTAVGSQTSGRIEFFTSDATNSGVGSAIEGQSGTGGTASAKLMFETNGSEAMRIDAVGNVGIGTSSPANPLTLGKISTFDLNATNSGQDALFINNASATAGLNAKGNSIGFGAPDGHGNRHAAISAVQTNSSDRDFVGLAFHTHNSGSQSDPMIETMRLTSDGKLGIGTTSPSTKLHVVNGSIQTESTSASGNAWYYAKNADKTYLMGVRGSSGDALSFYDSTTDVERMQIASSGDVTFNNDGADADFTIKDDNNSTLFFAHAGASLPYVKTAGVHMHDSDNDGGLSRHQTVTGEVTAPASGTTIELVQIGHTNICNVSIIAKQANNVGGIAYRTVGAFNGLSVGGTVTERYLGGGVTDINIFYQNGGSNAYTINATITYTGTAPTLYFTVDGKASQNFEKLV